MHPVWKTEPGVLSRAASGTIYKDVVYVMFPKKLEINLHKKMYDKKDVKVHVQIYIADTYKSVIASYNSSFPLRSHG